MSQNGSVGRQISSQSAGDVVQRAVCWIFFRVCHCLAFGLPSSFVGRYTDLNPVHNQVLPLPYAFC